MTVLASHPSVSIDTDTTQRTCSPSRPLRPTVFMTSRTFGVVDLFDVARTIPLTKFSLEGLDLQPAIFLNRRKWLPGI